MMIDAGLVGVLPGQVIGKTPWMQSVVLENAVDRMGTLVDVAIGEAYELSLKGEIPACAGMTKGSDRIYVEATG